MQMPEEYLLKLGLFGSACILLIQGLGFSVVGPG